MVDGALGTDIAAFDPLADLPADVIDMIGDFARRRIGGEPVWRILGERDFWGLTFKLSPETLEPRPDSEAVIEAALAWLGEGKHGPLRLLDLGVGSGCLLIALLSECRSAHGLGIDVSEAACAAAARNATDNGVGARARFQRGDWLEGVPGPFDLIVSNPPYIPTADIAGLAREVREHDPRRALDGGEDGLDAYRTLASGLAEVLAPGGCVVLEIGAGQEADVAAILRRGGLAHRATRHDLGGHPRALVFTAE